MGTHDPNMPEAKANRERQGFIITVVGMIGIIAINEYPNHMGPEVAAGLAPIVEICTALAVPPTLLGLIVYGTRGSRLAWGALKLYFFLFAFVGFAGLFAIPILILEGVL